MVTSLVSLAWLGGAMAFPSFRHHVPNGLRVPCPENATGCEEGDTYIGEPKSVCKGLGHASCKGGAMPLNAFGQALQAASYKWTEELCNADSDGDGVTNGEELGDPCCTWNEGDGVSPYMASWTPSHPGDASDAPSGYAKPTCDEQVRPAFTSPGMAKFNDGEEQRHVDFVIKNFTVPEQRTVYADFVFNFDDEEHDIYHIVFGTAIVDKPKLLHHFVVSGCTQKINASLEGTRLEQQPDFCNVPVGGFAGWAPGAILWDMPVYAGVPIGKGVQIVALNVNVHYTDGDVYPGTVTQDGIRVFYTPTLRSQTVHSVSTIGIGFHRSIVVPPNRERYFLTRSCTVQDPCKDSDDKVMRSQFQRTCREASWLCNHAKWGTRVATFCPKTCQVERCAGVGPVGLPIVAVFYHAHLLGAAMYQTLTRGNTTWDLGSQSRWHYDDQAMFPLMSQNLTVQPGDVIQSTCVFNSVGRAGNTLMGPNTWDEMCFTQVNTAHPTNDTARGFLCNGNIWAGDLLPGDNILDIAKVHPYETAMMRWQAAPSGQALTAVKRESSESSGCSSAACRENGKDNKDCCGMRELTSCAPGYRKVDGNVCDRGNGWTAYSYSCCEDDGNGEGDEQETGGGDEQDNGKGDEQDPASQTSRASALFSVWLLLVLNCLLP